MKMINNNIIQKTIVDLQYNGHAEGFTLQKKIEEWVYNDFMPALGNTLDKMAGNDVILKIDKLELNIETEESGPGNWLELLSKEIIRQLSSQLYLAKPGTAAGGETGILQKSREENFAGAFIYFLQHGALPWWSTVKDQKEFFEELDALINAGMTAGMKTSIRVIIIQQAVQQRMIWQLPGKLFYSLLQEISVEGWPGLHTFISTVEKDMEGISVNERKALQGLLKKMVLENLSEINKQNIEKKVADKFVQAAIQAGFTSSLQQIARNNGNQYLTEKIITGIEKFSLPPVDNKEPDEKNKEQSTPVSASEKNKKESSMSIKKETEGDELTEGLYVNNAGLVIVAGFLPVIFKRLALADGDKITDESKAACLVQFLASGKENVAEFELGIAKTLCGIEMLTPVNTGVTLSDEEKKEVTQLLLSAIEYWPVIRDTSIDGLRESFLRRDGKLSFNGNEWLLQVEQKPYDMLLQSLPWNISMIKLPWMKYMLKTEWAY